MFKNLKIILKRIITLRNEIIFYAIFILFTLYGIFDITTSRQTYHLSSNRLPSQIMLILLNVCAFVGIVIFVSSFILRKKNIFKLFHFEHYFLYFSILGLIVCAFLSLLVNKTSLKNFSIEVIYFVSFFLLTLYFFIASSEVKLKRRNVMAILLFLFFMYYFFLLFYYFYLQGRPTSSGSLRVPVLSHVFFPMSLIPSIRHYLKNKVFYIYIVSLPLVIIADKASVFLVFFAYFVGDFIHSSFYKKNKVIFRVFLIFCAFGFAGLLVVANTLPGSFLYSKLSFYAVIYQSGRIQNWTNIGSDFKNFSLLQFFIGKGTSSTLLVNYGTAAHNDFLEYFYDYGILGLLSIVVFWLYFLIRCAKEYKNREIDWFLLFLYVSLFMCISAIFSNANLLLTFSVSGFAFGGCTAVKTENYSKVLIRQDYTEIIV